MFRRIDKATNAEYKIIRKLARSTIPSKTDDFVRTLYKKGIDRTFTHAEMSQFIGLPVTLCGRIAENLLLLGVMKKASLPGIKTEWHFTDDFINVVNESEIYL